jgi:hypothetical protein
VDVDRRHVATLIARSRSAIGLALMAAPGPAARVVLGRSDPSTRVLMRMIGVRDLALGLGAVAGLRQHTQGPEWLGWGAVADAVDALAFLFTRRLPARSRVLGTAAAGAAVAALVLARALADDETTPALRPG